MLALRLVSPFVNLTYAAITYCCLGFKSVAVAVNRRFKPTVSLVANVLFCRLPKVTGLLSFSLGRSLQINPHSYTP